MEINIAGADVANEQIVAVFANPHFGVCFFAQCGRDKNSIIE